MSLTLKLLIIRDKFSLREISNQTEIPSCVQQCMNIILIQTEGHISLPFSREASVMDSCTCFIGEDAFIGAGIFNGKCNELGASERSESDDWYSSLRECRCNSTSTTFSKEKENYCWATDNFICSFFSQVYSKSFITPWY